VLFDTRNRVLARETFYVGSPNSSYMRADEVFREPIRRQTGELAHVP
jgi:hypothetical protein